MTDVEQMAADVAGLMDRLELARAHVLGISLGGRIAMALALAEPARVYRLILVATSPRAAGARWLVRAGMTWLPTADAARPPPPAPPRHEGPVRRDHPVRRHTRLSQITAPVLIVHGTSDHVDPVALARQMHALIPGSRLVLIDGGHLAPLLTQHERLVAEVSAFLTESVWLPIRPRAKARVVTGATGTPGARS